MRVGQKIWSRRRDYGCAQTHMARRDSGAIITRKSTGAFFNLEFPNRGELPSALLLKDLTLTGRRVGGSYVQPTEFYR
jgi:hypothetical protein